MICLSYTSTEEINDLYKNAQSFLARIKYMNIVIEQENYNTQNSEGYVNQNLSYHTETILFADGP